MDARQFLDAVAAAYAAIQSYSVTLLYEYEFGDADSSQTIRQRIAAHYQTPNLFRIHQPGPRGMSFVSDGADTHTHFAAPGEYYKTPTAALPLRIGVFQPEFPHLLNHVFLFPRIAELVEDARMIDATTIEVTYQTLATLNLPVTNSPVRFTVNPETSLIESATLESTVHFAAESQSTRHKLQLQDPVLNRPIPPETFQFTQPANAPAPTSQPDHRHSTQSRDGETRIETTHLILDGHDLHFERRLTINTESQSLRIEDKVTSPAGETRSEFQVPLR